MQHTYNDWQFYHIYPLGFCNAPENNDFTSEPCLRMELLRQWIPHLKKLGTNALYLGPVFESSNHGYDTQDYYTIDRRLGTNEMMKHLTQHLHHEGIKIVLDGVFNHVGRDFWAFKDLQRNFQNSRYQNWFTHINFSQNSPYNDHFSYEGWNEHYNLVKLNLHNTEVKKHLFGAVKMWIEEFGIDGIRLDACNALDLNFLKELSDFVKKIKPDLWLMGEIIHGDYRTWANSNILDSVTNYECYKGLWSSLNDVNLFEIDYSLNRQFGRNGLYKNLVLYNFADNHDVNRVASSLIKKEQLHPLYLMLYTIPGIPSVYYGSEWGIQGEKRNNSDRPLRPSIDLYQIERNSPHASILETITRLSKIRMELKSLRYGDYTTLHLNSQQLIFSRIFEGEQTVIALNTDEKEVEITLQAELKGYDILNNEEIDTAGAKTLKMYPNWGRIIKFYEN